MPQPAAPPPSAGPARFTGRFTQQEAIPEEAVEAAVAVLRSGRLHRYDLSPGETGQAAALEAEFAAWQGAGHCLALASGGQALQIALRAAGVEAGHRVLTNAFTLAPVPGAIAGIGARPVLVETTEDLRLDLGDLEAKAPGGRALMVSHMRGHLSDMDAVTAAAARHGLIVIEDCAHAMGARWRGVRAGRFGRAACFSTQSYKHLNSGEGGLLTSDDPDLMARAIVLSGSYMLHDRHGAAPPPEHFARVRLEAPNLSARMDNLRAAILRPQIRALDANVARWNARHDAVAEALAAHPAIRLPQRPEAEAPARSSIQFRLPGLGPRCAEVVERAGARGVALRWFGATEPQGYTSAHASWRFVAPQSLPRTDRVLADLLDMRLPLSFTLEDCRLIGAILVEVVDAVAGRTRPEAPHAPERPGADPR